MTALRKIFRLCLLFFAAAVCHPLAGFAEDMPIYKLMIKDGRFYPENLEVQAGVRFKVAVTNEGPGPEEFESKDLKKETIIAAGITRTIVFAPLKPGAYKFFGEFHMDTANGQIVAK